MKPNEEVLEDIELIVHPANVPFDLYVSCFVYQNCEEICVIN